MRCAASLGGIVLLLGGCAVPPLHLGQQPATDLETFDTRMARARSLEQTGKLDDARQVYQQLIVDGPPRPEPYHRLAVVADHQRRHREAQNLYTEALRLRPDDPLLLGDLGYCFYLQGQLDKAESALLKAVSRAPADPRLRNNLGLVYGQQQRDDEALDSFRHAGSEADAQYNLAFVLASRGDNQGACDRFRLALAADPTHTPARKALAAFEHQTDDADRLDDDLDAYAGDETSDHLIPYVEATNPAQTDNTTPAAALEPATANHHHTTIPANANPTLDRTGR